MQQGLLKWYYSSAFRLPSWTKDKDFGVYLAYKEIFASSCIEVMDYGEHKVPAKGVNILCFTVMGI